MKKLLLVLLAFLAICTYIRAYDAAETGKISPVNSVEITR